MSENTGLLRCKDKQVHVAFSQPLRIDGAHLGDGFGSVRAEAIDATLLGVDGGFATFDVDCVYLHPDDAPIATEDDRGLLRCAYRGQVVQATKYIVSLSTPSQ